MLKKKLEKKIPPKNFETKQTKIHCETKIVKKKTKLEKKYEKNVKKKFLTKKTAQKIPKTHLEKQIKKINCEKTL